MSPLALSLLLLAAPSSAAPPAAAPTDEKLVSRLLERARKAGDAKDRKGFLGCLTAESRSLFEKLFPEQAFEPVDIGGRAELRLIELRKHGQRPWAVAVVPAKEGGGEDGIFLRKEDGRWLIDDQHGLLVWDTVEAIMRTKKGERRQKQAVQAPTMLAKQAKVAALPEGWAVEDPSGEDDWSHLPGVQEAFIQRMHGPREKHIRAKFILFANSDDAEWELWRRRMELTLKSDLSDKQPSLGEAAVLGRHSSSSYELFSRKGRSLLILYGNSEDVIAIGERIVAQL
jgi:hypothetical protein